ncbi:MAG TPA: TetR/AcrR family transcriptional regulator [Acidimicrobiales bacterium]|nr:TetR/AcrR family transcriptional regulator [Acidimicrobiales bacterium]
MPRPKQRTPELRAEVLRVALAMLAEDGAEGVTARRVAEAAGTSPPAVYELFGDKAGLVREMFFEGFRRLGAAVSAVVPSDDPVADVDRLLAAYRTFARRNPALVTLMFSRPFAEFDPGPEEARAGAAVRELVVDCVRRAAGTGSMAGDPTDVAHVLLALAQGLAAQEIAGWLGSSAASRRRRWELAASFVRQGLVPTFA